jgi:hypothetical protein
MQLVIALLAVVLGAMFCFGGWRFFLLILPFWGLLVGFNVGTEATRALFGDGTFATLTSWAVGAVFALVFAVLAYLYWYAAIAILGGTVGYILGASAWGLIGNEQGVVAFVIGVAVGVIFAIGTLILNVPKWLVVGLTSIGGAAVIVAGWFILTGQIPTDQITWNAIGDAIGGSIFWLIIWAGLVMLGFVAQMVAPAYGPDTYQPDQSRYRYGS